ncbi:Amiloride-sensitive amine oxidase [copper-containing] [Merluccius polli]|uniref:Amine oxidase n=1 Tax=Merluccius polli TaxID=89951 RepID=A0AA47N5J8_MERPO|nr:Amiloride-sensitive amine oxidase [copper-containing] [Merluccius polli]
MPRSLCQMVYYNYGTKVYNHVLGNLHTHLIHYKVDLDISGRENSFESIDVKYVNFTNPWNPNDTICAAKRCEGGGRVTLAVTRHKDIEASSTSLYNENDPWEPVVSFEKYIRQYNNNEKLSTRTFQTPPHLETQWASSCACSTSLMRIPLWHPGALSSFDRTRPETLSFRWTPDVIGHCVSDQPFSYNGSYAEV